MQQQLFDTSKPSASTGLTITKAGKQKLSKNQEAFNKLTQKIERLQKDIKKQQLQFDLALKIYGNELYPAQLRVLEKRYKLIIVLWDIYNGNRLSKPNQRHLKNVLQFHLCEYFEQTETEPDEILRDIFSGIESISYEKMMQDEKEKQAAQLKKMFKKVKVDMRGVDMEDEAAVAKKIAEAKQKIEVMQEKDDERERLRYAKKSKTARQAEYEKTQQAVAEMKQKNISTIYKQLAKLFHPDLEQDAERKTEKEILMKELITAYESKNLHALLTLELRWIHKENDHLESLTEEKLAIYLQILKEQARGLEQEKNNIFQHPQYSALANRFGFSVQKYPVQIVRQQVENTNEVAQNFENDIADFESDLALRHVNEMIKQWKQKKQNLNEEEEMLKMFFG